MYGEIQSVLYARRTIDVEYDIHYKIDSAVLLLMDVVNGHIFEKASSHEGIEGNEIHKYKNQLDTHGIDTVKSLLENPDILYEGVALYFKLENEALKRDTFDKYYHKLVNDAEIKLDVERTLLVYDLLHMGPIPDRGNAMLRYDKEHCNRSRDEARQLKFFYDLYGFSPLTLPEEDTASPNKQDEINSCE